MARAKYLPPWLSNIVRETGAHFMCILSKAAERGVSITPENEAKIRELANECVREGKLVPVKKFLMKLGLAK